MPTVSQARGDKQRLSDSRAKSKFSFYSQAHKATLKNKLKLEKNPWIYCQKGKMMGAMLICLAVTLQGHSRAQSAGYPEAAWEAHPKASCSEF